MTNDKLIREKPWNRCDFCGRFISYHDLESGKAYRALLTPDSAITVEEFITQCAPCRKIR